jgi:hypothetical protein
MSSRQISFRVTAPSGTVAFCNVTLPNSLIQNLWQGSFTVLVDGAEPTTMNNWTDGTYTHVYFTYPYTAQEVIIIPEFPTALLSLIFILGTLIAIVLVKGKSLRMIPSHKRVCQHYRD